MVAHLGESAMAAVTAGSLNSVAAFVLPVGVVFVVSSFSAQYAGRGDLVSARRFAWYGLIVAGLAQGVMFLGLPFLDEALASLDYAPQVESAMNSYLAIRLLSTGVVVGVEALGNYYGGLGNTAIAMKANIAAMISNVFLNWLLIDGHLGAPALGIRGAALASVCSTTLAFVGLTSVFLWRGRGLASSPLKGIELWRLLRFGFPSGLNWSFEFFAFIAFVNVVVASLGTSALAAMMAVIQINSLAFMPAFGMASSGSILVGQSIGKGRKDEVPSLVALTFACTAAWMGVAGLAYLIVPSLLLSPFVSPDSDGSFMRVGVAMLMMSGLWQLFDGAGITLTESLRAAGDTRFPMWTRGVLAWLVFLPGSWISVRYFGGAEKTAMAWLLTYLALLAIVLYFRFRGGAWRDIELVEETLSID
jgi:MATE family multidrug resistance protein